MNKTIGYKAFDKNLQCRRFQYRVDGVYKEDSASICNSGFHFCKRIEDVFNYYPRNEETRVCEIIAEGKMETKGDKSCAQVITIIRELTKEEVNNIMKNNAGSRNAGSYNAGIGNAGSRNAGSRNAGSDNAGSDNAGSDNAGIGNAGSDNAGSDNAGSRNAGSRNAGSYNAGSRNAGSYNAGSRNAGSYNAGSDNVGIGNAGSFCLSKNTIRLFDQDSGLAFDSDIIKEMQNRLNRKVKPILRWICSGDMTESEKTEFPSHKTTGGFLRNMGKTDYSALNNPDDRAFFELLPNFNAETFFIITGVDFRTPKTVKVTCNGQEIEIDLDKAKELGLIK